MKQYKIQDEHVPVLREFCAYTKGYKAGVQDSIEKLTLRLIEVLAEQSPASGANQEPTDADSRLSDTAVDTNSTGANSATE